MFAESDEEIDVSDSFEDEDDPEDEQSESEEEASRFLACLMPETELHPEELFHNGTSYIVRKTDSSNVHFKKALYYFEVSSAKGHEDSNWILCRAREWIASGKALPQTQDEVRAFFDSFVHDGADARAFCFSAWLWHDENPSKAFQLYEKSVEAGQYNRALARLGYCYDHGSGTQKNITTAVEFYKRAAAKNHPVALYNLVCCPSGLFFCL